MSSPSNSSRIPGFGSVLSYFPVLSSRDSMQDGQTTDSNTDNHISNLVSDGSSDSYLDSKSKSPATGCIVNNLPPELLSWIFVMGDQMFRDEEDEDEDEDEDPEYWKQDNILEDTEDDNDWEDESNDDDPDCLPSLPFQVLVSHVCQYWRRVAIETPCLWNVIDFSEGKPYEKSRVYLERSKGYPLSIDIDCIGDDTDLSLSSVSGDSESACDCPDVTGMLALVMPHVGRWADFVLRASDYVDIHAALSTLATAPSAPLLESLYLYHHEDVEEDRPEFAIELKTPFVLFDNHLPKLKRAVFWGVHIDWRNTRFLENLTELELAYHSQDVRPTFEEFFNILRASPSLETLDLCLSGPAGDPLKWTTILPLDPQDDSSISPFGTAQVDEFLTLQSLHRLALGFHPPEYMIAILHRLSLPNLRELSFDFEDDDYSTFVEYITSPAKHGANRAPIIENLKSIKLVQLPCSHAAAKKLYETLKNLEELRLNFNHLDKQFLDLLCKKGLIRANSDTDSSRTYPLLPSLTYLMVSGLEASSIRILVQARRDAGVPLKKLYVDRDGDVGEADEHWLRLHVDEFRYFEGSDDEFSESDEEDGELWLSPL